MVNWTLVFTKQAQKDAKRSEKAFDALHVSSQR